MLSRFSSRLGGHSWPRTQLSTSTNSLAPATISFASCGLCLALCAAAALVHAFVTNRLDHCSSILIIIFVFQIGIVIHSFIHSGSNCPSWSGSPLCRPSHLAHTEVRFCFFLYAWHATLTPNCISYTIAVLLWRCPWLPLASAVNRYLVYLDDEPFFPLLLASY